MAIRKVGSSGKPSFGKLDRRPGQSFEGQSAEALLRFDQAGHFARHRHRKPARETQGRRRLAVLEI